MPVKTGTDGSKCFAQWGSSGKKYYYTCGSTSGRKAARRKAHIQGGVINKVSGGKFPEQKKERKGFYNLGDLVDANKRRLLYELVKENEKQKKKDNK